MLSTRLTYRGAVFIFRPLHQFINYRFSLPAILQFCPWPNIFTVLPLFIYNYDFALADYLPFCPWILNLWLCSYGIMILQFFSYALITFCLCVQFGKYLYFIILKIHIMNGLLVTKVAKL